MKNNDYSKVSLISGITQIGDFYKKILKSGEKKGKLNSKKKKIRFISRVIFYLPQSINIAKYIMKHKYLSSKVFDYPVLPGKIQRPYLCNLFDVNKRLKCIKENYNFIDCFFPKEISEKLYKNHSIELFELKGNNEEIFKVHMDMYSNFDKEGELSLKILNSKGVSLSKVTFSFIKEKGIYTLFIGGIQGPRKMDSIKDCSFEDKDYIKEATKSLAGLFPKRILLEAIYAIGKCLDDKVRKVCVGNNTHVYLSKRYENKKIINANYDEFLLTINAEKLDSGLWELPSDLVRKDILDVPSKKRSEYRKKYVILDEINTSIFEKFGKK
ncbi:MAG: VirK/YbjX family protein [Fusobacteriaceae bacterium]